MGTPDLTNDQTRDWLLNGAVFSGGASPALTLPDEDVLFMDESMKQFVEQTTAGHFSARGKVNALVAAVLDPAGFGLVYEPMATYPATQVFQRRRANCLSFTLMMVPMLRHLGVTARFNDVDVPLISDLPNETMLVFYKHINVVVQYPREGRAVLDLDLEEYDKSYEQRIIADHAAMAQYYNNRAMEYLLQENISAAFPYLVQALSIDSEQSYLWGNLGSLYQRAGKLTAARAAYEVALAEDSGDLVAMSNAARLYAVLGDTKRTESMSRRATFFRDRNPYYRYLQAINAFRSRDYQAARAEITAAIGRYDREHRFHFLLGAIYEMLGRRELAVESMNTALALTSDDTQIARYRGKMDRLFSSRH